MMLLYNITLKYIGDILCPAKLESESLPTEWVCERSSMEPLLLLLWVQRILTIIKPLTHICVQMIIIDHRNHEEVANHTSFSLQCT